MNDDINFKNLWQQRALAAPDVTALYSLANKTNKKLLVKLIATNVLYVATATCIVAIWLFYKPQLLTTKIGISLTILAMTILLLAQNQLVGLLKKVPDTIEVKAYLNLLQQLQKKQLFLQTTMLNIYFVLLSIGLYLYMYEYVGKSVRSFALAYGVTSIWIAFNWFYVRPKNIKKQQAKTNDLIAKFENLHNQLTNI